MVYSSFKKQRIVSLHLQGYRGSEIVRLLREEKMTASRKGVYKFTKNYEATGSIGRRPGSGRPSKIDGNIKAIVEEQMRQDDETTATQLYSLLRSTGNELSLRTILRCRSNLGWTFRGSSYCQLLRSANVSKRLDWAKKFKDDSFEDVIWTDESSIQLETHRRFCCRKIGERPRNKPRPKHPVKVHVWAGISMDGATGICIFDGIMDAPMYISILRQTLLPFIQRVYPNGHRFMQDNDPKHTSKLASTFMEENSIVWWKTPAESPDLNPIENLWHELKEYVRREVKPKTKSELVSGIAEFWQTVTVVKCRKYIGHLKKVIPRVIELNGDATGY